MFPLYKLLVCDSSSTFFVITFVAQIAGHGNTDFAMNLSNLSTYTHIHNTDILTHTHKGYNNLSFRVTNQVK